MEVVFAGISNKSAAFWSRIGKALNVDVNNIHEIEFEVQQEAQKPLDPGSFNQKILVRGGSTDDIQIDILKRDIQNLKAQNTELLKSLSKSSDENNTGIDRIAKGDDTVTHAAESIQKKGHTENDTEKMSANLLINTGKKGQNKQTEAQQIAKFIKRFRERYKQGIVNKNTETRERNEALAKKDWQYLEKRGYVINKNPDDKTKLIITKS
ncbi:MAG: hypothetical protein IPJ74_26470 [Saprospiraceae bacterium]|nr:hypothetical protein [Saprospiraceae bacterium]